jgi:hypothetical protein
MDPLDDNDIAKLLRLKRFEQPPPAYFENFLHEFHRRQRDELLRQPLWRICLQRAHDFMFSLNVPSLTSYPAAVTAMLLIVAVLSLKIYQTPDRAQIAHHSAAIVNPVNADGEWTLDPSVATRVLSTKPLRNNHESALTHRGSTPPRYVLDSVPVSYEPTFRF